MRERETRETGWRLALVRFRSRVRREIESFFLLVAWPCNFEELREPQFREVKVELAS